MKTAPRIPVLLLLGLLSAAVSIAQGPGGGGRGPGGPGGGTGLHPSGGPRLGAGPPADRPALAPFAAGDDLAALDRFLSLSDEELDRMQQAIARVRAMSPQERAAFRERILAYRALPAPEREAVRSGWGRQRAEDRDGWRTMMQSLPEAERAAVQKELETMPPEERTAWRLRKLEEWRKQQKPAGG